MFQSHPSCTLFSCLDTELSLYLSILNLLSVQVMGHKIAFPCEHTVILMNFPVGALRLLITELCSEPSFKTPLKSLSRLCEVLNIVGLKTGLTARTKWSRST
jgi:hypothetical protein